MSSSRLTGCYVLLTLVTILSSKSRAQYGLHWFREDGISVRKGNRTLLFGQELTIPCRYIGTVRELRRLGWLEWLHNGDVYSQSGSLTSADLFTHNLIVENISLSDSGEYSCRAILTNGDTRGPVSAGFIKVLDPSIINVPPRQYVLEGRVTGLQCSADYPIVSARWEPHFLVRYASIEAELNGEYMFTCRLSFDYGRGFSKYYAVEAIVIVPPKIIASNIYPLTTIHYTSSSTPVSLSVYFRSRTRNTTTITWERVGGVLPSNTIETTFIDIYGNGNTSLQFTSPSRADSGTYRMTVNNSVSVIHERLRIVSATIELRVKTLPALSSNLSAQSIDQTHSRISWTLNPKTQEEEASYLYLTLLKPMYKVFPVPPSRKEFILEVEPGNDYLIVLTARNDDGNVNTNSFLFTTQPDSPHIRSVEVQRLSSTSLAVTVVLYLTGGGDITNITLSHTYHVRPTLVLDSPPEKLGYRKWGGMVSTLGSFLPYKDNVQFLVTVTNERQLSALGSAQQTFTPRIRSVSVQRLNSTSLAVTVALYFTGGGDITSITLTYMYEGLTLVLDSPPQELENRTWGGVASNRRLGCFLPYTDDVQFSVTVTNEKQLSALGSAQQTFILPGPPSRPTVLSITATSLRVQSQLTTTGTKPLTKVVMVVSDGNGQVTTQNITGEFSNAQSVIINAEGLSPETYYVVMVHGVNAGGEGPNSDPMLIKTAASTVSLGALIGISIGGCVVVILLLIIGTLICTYDGKSIKRNKRIIDTTTPSMKMGVLRTESLKVIGFENPIVVDPNNVSEGVSTTENVISQNNTPAGHGNAVSSGSVTSSEVPITAVPVSNARQ